MSKRLVAKCRTDLAGQAKTIKRSLKDTVPGKRAAAGDSEDDDDEAEAL